MQVFYTAEQLDTLPADAGLGVIGNPIAHSKSPQMQQPALDAAGIPARYVRLLAGTEEGEFESLLCALAGRGFTGVNVTVPFKKKAHDTAVQLDPLAQLSGAVPLTTNIPVSRAMHSPTLTRTSPPSRRHA